MRAMICVLMLLGLAACHAHDHRGGSVRVDGVGSANWGGHGGKGCPPGLARQGRC